MGDASENAAATVTNESNDASMLVIDGGASLPSTLAALADLAPGAAGDDDVTFEIREALLSVPNTPCSNDNPDWDKATQPCPQSLIPLEVIFDEAVVASELAATEPTEPTASGGGDIVDGVGGDPNGAAASPSKPPGEKQPEPPMKRPASSPAGAAPGSDLVSATVAPNGDDAAAGDLERFHSCVASSPAELEAEGGVEDLLFGFDYEVYVAPAASGEVGAVLSEFELRLADGVAGSMGQRDCSTSYKPGGGSSGLGTEVQLARRFGDGRRALVGGTRKSTLGNGGNWPLNGAGAETLVVGVSMDPPDSHAEAATCSTNMTLAVRSTCFPVAGAMTAWIADDARRGRLRRGLVDVGAREEQEAMLLDAVRSYIEGEEASYLSDDLLYVAYIGPRDADDGVGAVPDSGGADPDPDDAVGTDPDPDGAEDVDGAYGANVQVPIKGDDDYGGPNAMLISLAAVAVLLVAVVLGAAYLHRRRRRGNRGGASGALDVESGAFPALTPESRSADGLKRGDESVATHPTQLENVRSADLFGIKGEPPSDASFQEGGGGSGGSRELRPPSSLGIGPASALATALRPSQSAPEDSPARLDMAPTIQEASEDDIEPMSPMNPEDKDDLSSTFDNLEAEEEGGDSTAVARSPESSLEKSSQVAELTDLWERPEVPGDVAQAAAENQGKGDDADDGPNILTKIGTRGVF